MKKTAIIIPTRLGAKRFVNKPLAKINGLPMIIHVMNRAQESQVGEVIVATPDNEIVNVVEQNGGNAVLTKKEHPSGSDRIYEAYLKKIKSSVDIVINLQGDMPNIKPNSISKLVKLIKENDCDIGTLASDIKDREEIKDPNIVKVYFDEKLKNNDFLIPKDFFLTKKDLKAENIYHHIGIYAFTKDALTQYVKLPRSKLEIERNLEQMRALENNMTVKVGLSDSIPLGVDTEEDLAKLKEEMN